MLASALAWLGANAFLICCHIVCFVVGQLWCLPNIVVGAAAVVVVIVVFCCCCCCSCCWRCEWDVVFLLWVACCYRCVEKPNKNTDTDREQTKFECSIVSRSMHCYPAPRLFVCAKEKQVWSWSSTPPCSRRSLTRPRPLSLLWHDPPSCRYHDGFLGQRIGRVASLAFHQHKMYLAAGFTDNFVSIYTDRHKSKNDRSDK